MEGMYLWSTRFFIESKRQDNPSSRLESSGDEVFDSNTKPLSEVAVDA